MAVRVFGKVEEEVTGKLERREVGCTQDVVGRYVYPLREVNDERKGVGKEVDTQAEQVFDNEVGKAVAGVEFH